MEEPMEKGRFRQEAAIAAMAAMTTATSNGIAHVNDAAMYARVAVALADALVEAFTIDDDREAQHG